MKTVLHIGCGAYAPEKLLAEFRAENWHEIRVDIDPAVKPDIVASLTDMSAIPDGQHDAIYSSHTLEHLHWHQVPVALGECLRVLRPGGTLVLKLPNLEAVCQAVAGGKSLVEPLYQSQVGPITALDVIYGYGKWIAEGNAFMAHKTGFSRQTLRHVLETAGFDPINVATDSYWNVWARAFKPT